MTPHQRKHVIRAQKLADAIIDELFPGDDLADTWEEAIYRQLRVANVIALMGLTMPDSRDWRDDGT